VTDDLQDLANEAFDAIEATTGKAFPHSTVREAFDSFNMIVNKHGLVWLIDSAKGTGMSHLGWCYWMGKAREVLGI
jgi:hypothetical protein